MNHPKKANLPAATTCEYSFLYIEADQPVVEKFVEYIPYLDKEDYRYVKLCLTRLDGKPDLFNARQSLNKIASDAQFKLAVPMNCQPIHNGTSLKPESEKELKLCYSYATEVNGQQYTLLVMRNDEACYLLIQKALKEYFTVEIPNES
jgi:hypothetical protein